MNFNCCLLSLQESDIDVQNNDPEPSKVMRSLLNHPKLNQVQCYSIVKHSAAHSFKSWESQPAWLPHQVPSHLEPHYSVSVWPSALCYGQKPGGHTWCLPFPQNHTPNISTTPCFTSPIPTTPCQTAVMSHLLTQQSPERSPTSLLPASSLFPTEQGREPLRWSFRSQDCLVWNPSVTSLHEQKEIKSQITVFRALPQITLHPVSPALSGWELCPPRVSAFVVLLAQDALPTTRILLRCHLCRSHLVRDTPLDV